MTIAASQQGEYAASLRPTPYEGKYRPEQRPNYASGAWMYEFVHIGQKTVGLVNTVHRSAPGGGYNGITTTTEYWRWNDEPGVWREQSGKIIPLDEAAAIIPDSADELAQRQLMDDRERAKELVETAFAGAPKHDPIEERGSYALMKNGKGFEVYSNGVAVTPHAVPEQIARGIFETLAPPAEHVLDEEPLERLLAR